MRTGIYKITNPKGSIYIGQSKNIESRINRYKKLQCCKNQHILYRSFKKYGVENHSFDIIETGTFGKKELNAMEKEYIVLYNSYRKYNILGMNLSNGGSSVEFDDSVRKKMSESRIKNVKSGITWSKLTIDEVVTIKKLIRNKIKQRDIAAKYNVKPSTITEIKKGRSWSNVKI